MKILSISAILTLILAGTAYGQKMVNEPAPSSTTGQMKHYVNVQEGIINVDIEQASFGNVMQEIADKAGFTLKITNLISQKKLSTRFSNVELERGIVRLLALINQKTYFMRYDELGKLTELEIFSPSDGKTKAKTTSSNPLRRKRPALPTPKPPVTKQDFRRLEPETESSRFPERFIPGEPLEEEVTSEPGAPYLPPVVVPEYIPPTD